MNKSNLLPDKSSFTYFIIYYSKDVLQANKPVIYGKLQDILNEQVTYHLLSQEHFVMVDIISKILQLPRSIFDLYRVPFDILPKVKNYTHNIIYFPNYFAEFFASQGVANLKSIFNPSLLLYDNRCKNEAIHFESIISSTLGMMSFEEFKEYTPKDIWIKLQEFHEDSYLERLEIPNLTYYLTDDELNVLPSLWFLVQNGDFERFINRDKTSESVVSFNNRMLDEYNIKIKAMKSVTDKNKDNQVENLKPYFKNLDLLKQFNHKPLVLTLPGIPNCQKKQLRNRIVNENNTLERLAIKNMGLYKAMSRNAAYIELDYMGQELYDIVYKLEDHCLGKINNKFIWRSLKKFGNIISKKLTEEQLNLLIYSKQITYYSDLPLGLAIFPGTTSPVCCYSSLSANNLTPLSILYQTEFQCRQGAVITKKCKVLFAECLNKDDRIRKFSDESWTSIEDNLSDYCSLEFVREDTNTVYKLKKFLRKHYDANVVIISAHGHYDIKRKLSGIVVGNEFWNANDNDFNVPEIVILSACHVSPKGVGAINISDLFFRNGAVSVIGTLIPINVMQNASFMQRLLFYMIEALERDVPKSLDEIWQHVVSTNAILEIVHSTKKLSKWAFTKTDDGTTPISKFMLGDNKTELRGKHVYEDSIKRLIDIARDDNMDKYVEAVMKSQGVFPESVFYILFGRPESVYFGK